MKRFLCNIKMNKEHRKEMKLYLFVYCLQFRPFYDFIFGLCQRLVFIRIRLSSFFFSSFSITLIYYTQKLAKEMSIGAARITARVKWKLKYLPAHNCITGGEFFEFWGRNILLFTSVSMVISISLYPHSWSSSLFLFYF